MSDGRRCSYRAQSGIGIVEVSSNPFSAGLGETDEERPRNKPGRKSEVDGRGDGRRDAGTNWKDRDRSA